MESVKKMNCPSCRRYFRPFLTINAKCSCCNFPGIISEPFKLESIEMLYEKFSNDDKKKIYGNEDLVYSFVRWLKEQKIK